MTKPTILVADNNPDFLDTCVEYFQALGYRVLAATTPAEAQAVIDAGEVHLAVLDVRLVQDTDKLDESGLALARQASPAVQKIVLTKHPNWPHARQSLGPQPDGAPLAVAYLDKREGLEVLAEHIGRILRERVRINWNLVIEYGEQGPGPRQGPGPLSFVGLTHLMLPGLDKALTQARANELEDAFRRLFFADARIRVDRLVWQRGGRVALVVYAPVDTGQPAEARLVILGPAALIKADMPLRHRPGAALSAEDVKETVHFAAYRLPACPPEMDAARSLHDLYDTDSKGFRDAVGVLFQEVLPAWQGPPLPAAVDTLSSACAGRLNLNPEALSPAELNARIQALLPHLKGLGLRAQGDAAGLALQVGEQALSYASPVRGLGLLPTASAPAYAQTYTPGVLAGDNVLVDAQGKLWLTDFADAGAVPAGWDCAALEAEIRFDWAASGDLLARHEMERRLSAGGRAFNALDTQDVDAPVRQALVAIQALRQQAAQLYTADARPYHTLMLWQAVRRVLEFDPARIHMRSEWLRVGHALLAAAMLAEQLQADDTSIVSADSAQAAVAAETFRLKPDVRTVYVGERSIVLTEREFQLFTYLYDADGEVRKHADIYRAVFGGQQAFDGNRAQRGLINQTIDRLREKVEPNPAKPRYILNITGVGYRLVKPG